MAKLVPRYRNKAEKEAGRISGYAGVWYDPTRRPARKYVTLHTKDEATARRRLTELEKKESLGLWSPWADPAPEPDVTIGEGAKRYERWQRKQRRRESTIAGARRLLEQFEAFLPPGCLLAHVETRHVRAFLEAPKKGGGRRAPATVRRYHAVLSGFYKWAHKEGLVQNNPVDVELPRLRRKEKAVLSEEELAALLRTIEADAVMKAAGIVDGKRRKHAGLQPGAIRWLADFVVFARHTGLRPAEVCNMRWGWVRWEERVVIVGDKDFHPKSGHQRRVPVRGEALRVLERLDAARTAEDPSAYVFEGINGGRLDPPYVARRFKHYAGRAGLPEGITLYALRHTAITTWANAGIPITTVQKIAGHADVKTTLGYVHVSAAEIDRAFEEFALRRATSVQQEPGRGRTAADWKSALAA